MHARYADDVRGFVQSIVRNCHDAEDVTHDVFAKLMRKIQKYEERRSCSPHGSCAWRATRRSITCASRRQIPVEEVDQRRRP